MHTNKNNTELKREMRKHLLFCWKYLFARNMLFVNKNTKKTDAKIVFLYHMNWWNKTVYYTI